MEVRTRIAPSPTGFPHIGTIYQVLFDYVFAKKTRGKFIVRIEDTDRARFVDGAEEVIFESLKWFNLIPDESPIHSGEYGPYRQSERLKIYKEYVQKLLDSGNAYYCFCTKERLTEMREQQEKNHQPPMYDKSCLKLSDEQVAQNLNSDLEKVVRMKIPENEKIKFTDVIAGELEFDTNLIDHQVILKADGYPTYHLAVVVDDYLMKISHIFRGTEWISSTPKHVLLYRYLGLENNIPQFIHLPLILNTEGGGKLSKRHGHASVDFYRNLGYLPEAVLNYLANIVWNHPEGKEIFEIMDLAKAFEVDAENKIISLKISKTGARFDLNKLDWMNGEYMRNLSNDELTQRLTDFLVDHPNKDKIAPLVPLVKERIKKLSDFVPLTDFMFEKPEYDKSVFEKAKVDNSHEVLEKIIQVLEKLEKPWVKADFETKMQNLAKELNLSNSQFFQLLRVAISGQLVTPPLFECMEILGVEEVNLRLKDSIEFLK